MERKVTQLDDSVTVPLSSSLKKLIRQLAEIEERDLAPYLRRILRRAVAEEASKAGLTKEAEAAGLEVATPA